MAVASEAGVGFWAAFDGSGFPTTWSMGYGIGGNDAEEFLEELLAFALGGGLEEGFSAAAARSQSAGEAYAIQTRAMASCRFEHDSTGEIVNQQVKPDLPG